MTISDWIHSKLKNDVNISVITTNIYPGYKPATIREPYIIYNDLNNENDKYNIMIDSKVSIQAVCKTQKQAKELEGIIKNLFASQIREQVTGLNITGTYVLKYLTNYDEKNSVWYSVVDVMIHYSVF